ncbi:PAS domain S-box protein [Maribacter sp. SA7]|uniref:PAS domain S-box protein n=1 Tax=Maribacter zhoushanensis TaxID=3030012 RepID=UPI0023ECF29E|nr:PAS domain S-box protein [Maribacter zhoushanensis]MDF4201417.1 PAS domain S-box protein [Maribacter zhoushanensis]
MSESVNRSIFKSPLFYGFLAFMLVFIISQFVAFQKYQLYQKSEQQEVEQRVSKLKVDLQNILGQSFNATQTLAFIVEHYGVPNNFDSVAQLLLNSNNGVDALELVNEHGVITHVHPLKGNEVIGLNILKDPDNKFGAKKTLEEQDYYTAGPLYLQQGGSGIIGRKPLYKDGKFNGFVAAVVRLSTVIKAIQLDTVKEKRFSYKLVKINADKTEETFFASQDINYENAIGIPLTASKGEWKLYVFSKQHRTNSTTILFSILGFLLSFVCGILVWFLMKQPEKLNRLVEEKTALLKLSQDRYRLLIEEASDAIILSDFNANILDINPYGVHIFGYSKDELLTKNLKELVSPEEADKIPARYKEMRTGKTVRSERTLVKKDGSLFHAEVSAKKLSNTTVLGIIRDITERKRADIEKQKLVSVIENSPGFIGLATLEGNPLFMNDAGKRLINLPCDFDINNASIFDLFPEKYKDVVQNEHLPAIMEKGLWTGEAPIRDFKNNTTIPLEFYGFLIKDKTSNEPIGIGSIGFDITERKKTQKEILELQGKMNSAIRIGKIGYWDFDIESATFNCSPLMYSIYEMDESTILTIAYLESIIHPDDLELHRQNVKDIIIDKTTHAFTYRIIVNGNIKYLMVEVEVIRDPENLAIKYRGTVIDITKEKEADIEILDLKNKMEIAMRIGKIGYWDYDFNTKILYWSPRLYSIYDVDPQIKISLPFVESLMHPDDLESHRELLRSVTEDVDTYSLNYRIILKDGSIKHIIAEMEVLRNEDKSPIKYRGTIIDITKQKEAEEKILSLQTKMNAAIRIGKFGYWYWDMSEEVVEWSKEMYEIHDIAPSTIMTPEIIKELIYSEDVSLIESRMASTKEAQNSESVIYRIQKDDLTFKYFLAYAEIIFSDDGHPLIYHGTAMDITKSVLAEKALKESQEKFSKAFQTNLMGMIILDEHRRVTEANKMAYHILNTTNQKIIGKTIVESGDIIIDENERERLWNKFNNEGEIVNQEYKIELKNGSKKTLLISMVPLSLNNTKSYLVNIFDDSKRKEAEGNLENQYLELQKTNSELDSFVYSASHELRAPLSSVLGLIHLIQLEEIEPKLSQHLNMMKKSIERLDSFIKDIIEYSRNKHLSVRLETINFTTLIENSLESFWYLDNTSKINIEVNIEDDISFVSDSKRISVLLNNFISNAIKYHDLNKDRPSIWISIKTSKKQAIIEVKDNGVGMAEDQLDKIFEMFYRVSSKVMGSGIGLFIVKEIITKLRGTIEATSKVGEGTKFTLKIPNELGRL